ncbi:hypothetical protein ACSMXM_16880 [Pacificimonas sp. ICDLI1SI03]
MVIEAAMTQVVANTGGNLLTTQGIVQGDIDCAEAGAGVLHYHHDSFLNKEDSITQCIDVQRGILGRYPGMLVYPGYMPGETHDATMEHLEPLYEAGAMTMLAFDWGHAIHAGPDEDGQPTKSKLGGANLAQASRLALYRAGFAWQIQTGPLDWVRYFGEAGRFRPSTVAKFYFFGRFCLEQR